MKTPLLLIACLATAVLLAGCAGTDDESTDGSGDTSRELNTDIQVEGDDANMTNETAANETTTGSTGG